MLRHKVKTGPFNLFKTIKDLSLTILYRHCRGCRKRRSVRSNSFFEEFPRVPLGKLLQKVYFFSAEDSQRRISRHLDLNASLIRKLIGTYRMAAQEIFRTGPSFQGVFSMEPKCTRMTWPPTGRRTKELTT